MLYPKACDYLHNKEETDLQSNWIKSHRISLTIVMQKSMSQDELKSQSLLSKNNVCALLVPGHISGISTDACSGQCIWHSLVHSSCRVCGIDFCIKIVRLILLHSVTLCDFWFSNQVAVHVHFFFVAKIINCLRACD